MKVKKPFEELSPTVEEWKHGLHFEWKDYHGKLVLINEYADDCRLCQQEKDLRNIQMKKSPGTEPSSLGNLYVEPATDGRIEASRQSEQELHAGCMSVQCAINKLETKTNSSTIENQSWTPEQGSKDGTASSSGFWHPQTDGRSFVLPATQIRQEESGLPERKQEMPKGLKFDDGKAPLDLIPREALNALGEALAYGANKYDRGNWCKGIEYSRLIAAALRHLTAYSSGEDLDPESGINHVSHALCNLAFLTYMQKNRTDLDDRWSK